MEDFMAMLVSMSWQASIVLVAVLAIRKLFEKLHISKKFMMLLWMIPFFCLIFPWKISLSKGFWKVAPTEMSAEKMTTEGTQISFLHMDRQEQNVHTAPVQGMAAVSEAGNANSAQKSQGGQASDSVKMQSQNSQATNSVIEQNQGSQTSDSVKMQNQGIQASGSLKAQSQDAQMSNTVKSTQNQSENTGISAQGRTEAGITETSPKSQIKQGSHKILSVLAIVWGTGVLILLACNGIWYIRLKRKLLCSIQVDEQLYVSDGTDTPMVFGVLKPRIYIPAGLPEEYRKYVVAHERTHIRHFHVLYKMSAYAVTCIHWFNPLVWCAFRLLDKDMEMACDEETVRTLGMEEQKAYAGALLGVANGSILKNKLVFVAPVAFEEGNVKARIKNIMSYKKTVTTVAVGAVICCVVVAGVFMTKEKPEAKGSITSLDKINNTIVSFDDAASITLEQVNEIINHYAYSERKFMPFVDAGSDGQPKITPVSYPDNDNLTFADLDGVQFLFSSGAGAWLTVVTIEADGTFHGYYSDTDAGTGDYMNPWGNKAESRFSGKFSEMEKVAPYEYRMTCEKLGVHGSIGEQRLEDGLLITTTEPYGFDYAGEFRLYLPGKDAAQLPEGYLSWSHELARSGALDCYGLYNVGGEQGYIVRSDLDYSSLDPDLTPSPLDIMPLEEDDDMKKPGNLLDKVENANKGSSYLAVKKGYYDEFVLRDLVGKGFTDDEYVELTFGEGGTFKGHCSQYRDMRGEDYPRGIREECYYNGRVASVTKTGEYEYTLKLEDIQIETPGNLGDERIEDGMKVITTLPYGISNTDELIVYIPGKSIRELPKPFVQQARRDGLSYAEKADGIVDQYVIYNPGEERGFVRALRLGL